MIAPTSKLTRSLLNLRSETCLIYCVEFDDGVMFSIRFPYLSNSKQHGIKLSIATGGLYLFYVTSKLIILSFPITADLWPTEYSSLSFYFILWTSLSSASAWFNFY